MKQLLLSILRGVAILSVDVASLYTVLASWVAFSEDAIGLNIPITATITMLGVAVATVFAFKKERE